MAMSAQVWETVQDFAQAFPPPASPAAPFGPDTAASLVAAHEEACRGWTRRLAEQLAYSHGVAWGHKRAGADRPPSKDAVATQLPFVGYDILRGSGTGAPELAVYPPLEHDLTGQTFIPVVATNHLGVILDPPDDDPDPPDEDPDVDVVAELVAIRGDLDAMKAELASANEQRQVVLQVLARIAATLEPPLAVKLRW
jgi:hypothetical protein